MELCGGPISVTEVQQEIPVLCSTVRDGGSQQVGVMYGVGCRTEANELWAESKIQTGDLDAWIADSIRRGVYSPGCCDLFIFDGNRLIVHLCHESDVHIETTDPEIIRNCTSRWLGNGIRVLGKRTSTDKDWKPVRCIQDAISTLESRE
jgi:hypothetical protein